jgi:uncharacterized protein
MEILQQKIAKLEQVLCSFESVVVGFSGGVDSTFLAAAAYRVLGEKAVAVTAYSPTLPESEKQATVTVAREIGIKHVLLSINELDDEDFVANSSERCYFCKRTRFSQLAEWARCHHYSWVLEGANADDVQDYRPGMKAVDELEKVASPLLAVGLTKAEIRDAAQTWGLSNWNKPSAACLSSRVVYGQEITATKLGQIEQAEELIKKICPGQVRVRHHGKLARIEVDANMIEVLSQPEVRGNIVKQLQQLGFTFVTLDLLGYHTGSMNAILQQPN